MSTTAAVRNSNVRKRRKVLRRLPGRTCRTTDVTLGWMTRLYPQLEPWRRLAEDWLKGETDGLFLKLTALSSFFEKYIFRKSLPLEPGVFLSRDTSVPDFYKTVCPDSLAGTRYNNAVHSFLAFVLLRDFSTPDGYGRPVVASTHHNPIVLRRATGYALLRESVHSPLPYGYIDELRQMLAAGPTFSDWHWAHSAMGSGVGNSGPSAPDRFAVTEDLLDKDDPDCVWRVRPRHRDSGGPVLEMWSPVRWVALLLKLILPLRTFQIRMLDSGEADTWRYDSTVAGNWQLNTGPLAEGSKRKPLQQ